MLKKVIKIVLPKAVKDKLRYFKNTYLDGYATKYYFLGLRFDSK